MPQTAHKLRANRKVIAASCSSCNQPIQLGEEVYGCDNCHGYHHAGCWETFPQCAKAPMPDSALSDQSATAAPASFNAPSSRSPSPQTEYPPAPVSLGSDERECPGCGKTIKHDAMKCRFCGRLLDKALIQQAERAVVPSQVLEAASRKANQSIWLSLLGLVICGILMAPAGIRSAHEALSLLNDYPDYQTSVRTRAHVGIALGWIVTGLWVIGLIARLVSANRP